MTLSNEVLGLTEAQEKEAAHQEKVLNAIYARYPELAAVGYCETVQYEVERYQIEHHMTRHQAAALRRTLRKSRTHDPIYLEILEDKIAGKPVSDVPFAG